jgi:hypothetical protein
MRRHRFAGLLAVGFVGSLLMSSPAGSAEQRDPECSGTAIVTFTPGLSDEPSSGTHSGRDGKTECKGEGERPMGPMATGWEGRFGTQDPDTCAKGGEGWGMATQTAPAGPENRDAIFTFQYFAITDGVISGVFQGDYFSGTFQLKPLEGDCVSSPVTKAELTFQGHWHEQRGAKHVAGVLLLL